MKQANHVFEKVTKYGIRKLSVGVGPVAIGTFLLAGGFFVSKPVSADQVTKDATVHMAYVAENELTAEEQQQVVHAIPEDYQNEDTFYLVYKRKGATQTSLPQTGSSDWVASGLGLATATMAVLLFSKKHRKKIIGLVLIGAAGQSLLVPIEVLALQNKELQAYNQTLAVADEADLAKGVIAIDGYEYVGYLRYSAKPELEQPLENTLQGLESSIKEETTVNQGTADKDSEGISWKKGTQESGHEGEAVVQPANPEYTGSISANGTQESGHEGEALVQPVAPEYTGPISANGTQEVGHEGEAVVQPATPEYTGSISSDTTSANGTQEVGHEGEAVVQPVNPAYTGSINSDTTSAKGTQESGHEGEALVQPVAPEYTGPISAKGTQESGHEGEALVQPVAPEYTGPISANGTQEVGHEGEAVVQPVNPAYTGSINSDTTSAKGTQESGHEGEALVQPENPVHTPVVGSITETETQAIDYPIEVITDDNKYVDEEVVEQEGKKGSQEIQKIYQTIDGVKVGEPTIVSGKVIEVPQPRKIRRGSKPLDGTTTEESIVELPFKEIVQEDDTLEKGTLQVVQEGQKGQNKITKVYKTYKGNKTAEEPTVTETVLVPVQDRIVRKGTKVSEKPVLTLTQIDKDDLGRSAKLSYNLTNPGSATITTIKAVLKQDGQVVQTLDIPSTTLTADLTNLDYYKPYTLTTTMTFDRGNGEESQVLADQTLQLDLKKVELKDFARTDLIKYDNQTEVDETRLTAVPQDLTNYYLKLTSADQKTTYLAVKAIEETTVDGKAVYKVTAEADNLVQRDAQNHFAQTYSYYIEKPKASQANVYYDFAELVNAIQANPSGEFRLGQSMSARHVVPNGKSYITTEFTGKLLSDGDKRFAIYDLEHPLFNVINGGTIKNINFENVDINRPDQNQIATLGFNLKNKGLIEDVKVTGSVTGNNDVAGIVNKIDEDGKIENVAFVGKINSVGNNSTVGGIAGSNYMGFVNRAYVDATITAQNANASMLVPFVTYMLNSWKSGTKAKVTNSVAKGVLDVKNTRNVGGIVAKTWPYGAVQDNVTYAKVIKGQEIFASNDVNDEDGGPHIKDLFGVVGYSSAEDGTGKDTKSPKKLKHLTKEEADKRVEGYKITADTFVSEPYSLNTLNNVSSQADFANIQDYNPAYKQAYKNIEKFQPFYNKDYIVYQANKLAKDHNLNTKEVLSVTPMNDSNFVTDLSDANKIIVHYADGSKDYFKLSESSEGLSNVKEYTVTDLGIKYTPNIVQKDHSSLINGIVDILKPIELQSDPIYQKLGRTGPNKVNAIKNLFLEESFEAVKANLTNLVTKLVQNEDHQLNQSPAAQQMILDKVEKNKAALLLGLTYLNRYYGVKFDDLNIKEIMLFKPDFYGKNVDVLDRLIEIGSKENNISGSRTYDAFGEVLAKSTLSSDLTDFLNYNRKLFTTIDNMNDWFIDAAKDKVYVVEKASQNEGVGEHKYRVYDNLSRGLHRKMILPLLNLDKTEMFLISTYDTMSYGTANKYNTTLEKLKPEIDLAAQRQINYLDFWQRLAADNVKNKLFKDIVNPIWEGFYVWGHGWPGWPERYGQFKNSTEVYAPIREIYGPVGEYYGDNGAMAGAYAAIYDNPYDNRAKVTFVMSNMISEYGASAFTHETTHINDRIAYFGGFGRREGTNVEAYAQGMLQSPATQGHQGEYGALGLNMTFERANDGNQWYNTNPNKLNSREAIDRYMKGYNDTLMLLDSLEGEAVLGQGKQELNNAWFKKVDKQLRGNSKNQYDKVRALSDSEKAISLTTIDDLVDNNLMTNRGPGNGVYKPEDFSSAYVNVPMMSAIYGGNTSEGSPGAMSFKHNTFRLWGYYGYEKGFLGYATNKYKQEAKAAGKDTLGDDFIISKISDGQFNSLEDFKKAYFKEVKEKASHGLTTVTIDGASVSSYDDLLALFKAAVAKDAASLKTDNNGNKSVSTSHTTKLKEAVYKKLLQETDSFTSSIFK
ncbi:Immunoglobulin A1 protease precursor [Streptococcus salivarius]|jgi:zinc metalloprotease ZmpB|uniref:Immunoglobulin A1 protease n=4 Tax=Streptococcus salivarius TaxID=1304 RepID=A0AAP3VBN2_STRSL|nr:MULTISPECIES: ZmpA/ZmpB/ZmpC family metallo-endopeptidase [Streptococcus]KJU93789.1 zinc metalloprotease [Streptococcus salivarius]MDB8590566.1 ZmpA/ZmpB/ZmpC family metallo-endopeptidase [Streptococcus salivarius]MDN5036354.1 ZmpA/ZmpB/ZmpC family metallo-endopeptidase [Streptococcus sp. SS6]MDU6579550.1 ZmpA/ZmpB/ZmpC family metallo-endopeptidase [Streptococcus salivarius]QEM33054.1 YSIRK-type signal peptide-containing protein [Streptococcus salivarius]